MSLPLALTPVAEADLDSAYTWYEEQQPGLGREFLEEVEAAWESLRAAPRSYAELRPGFRRCLVARFPYAVFYHLEPDRIVILAVLHQARDPEVWPSRWPS